MAEFAENRKIKNNLIYFSEEKFSREDLSKEEREVLSSWSDLDSKWRDETFYSDTDRSRNHRKILSSLLDKLPSYSGVTYRGLWFTSKFEKERFLSNIAEGSIWENKKFMSTTPDEEVALEFTDNPLRGTSGVVLSIQGRSGKDISNLLSSHKAIQREKEVLFPPGQRFRISHIEEKSYPFKSKSLLIEMKEI